MGEWISVAFSGINLVLILDLIFNKLHHIEKKIDLHIQYHLERNTHHASRT